MMRDMEVLFILKRTNEQTNTNNYMQIYETCNHKRALIVNIRYI